MARANMFDSLGSFFKKTSKSADNANDAMEDESEKKGWGAFLVSVFKRFVMVLVFGIIGANFIYLSGLPDANLAKLFPTNSDAPFHTGPFCCGEPDMHTWPYTYLKEPPNGLLKGFRNAIVMATKDTYSLMRHVIRQLLKVIGGFANGTGALGRWSTYFLWNAVFQMVGAMVPIISAGIFWINVFFYTFGSFSASMPSTLDPNTWTIAQWAYFYGVKDNLEKSKWFYALWMVILISITITVVVCAYIFLALPMSWFVGGGASLCITIMFYLTFLFVPICRDRDKLRSLMACDHKLYLAVFGLLCVMDARSTLDKTTAGAMEFVYFAFILHAIYKYFN